VLSIAAASIIAKVTRDRLMCALGAGLPGLRFRAAQGLRRPRPPRALDRLGPSTHHRSFFRPGRRGAAKAFPELPEPDLFVVDTETDITAASEAA